MGRITSVCEITSLSGSGTCPQASSTPTGYFTTYTYDNPANSVKVSQNAQATPQARMYQYDGLGRITSESNPETGTISYTYDTDTTCGTSNGDLVKKVDADNNVTCYAYDGLHRATSVTYPSGPYSSVTPSKTFVYDSTTFTCTNSNAYVKGRLAEAYTGPSTAKITDIAYCYSPRGEIWDAFESTPHSAGTYHTTATYWGNGTLNTLGGVHSLSSWTFGLDGEGRPYSATYGASTDWVTGTTYYPSQSQTTVNFGNGDNDVYGYDQTTGRMNSFKFTVGSSPKTLTGTPGWNANGTLGTLAISDQFNSSNTQNCGYVYDDLARIQSASCGSTWQQTFTLDPFGNLSKSGSSSFAATYLLANGTTNNQEQTDSSCVPTYDANGNLTKDCTYGTPATYAWDADGNVITLNSLNVTYDALDREVETASGSTYAQILYGPIGKMALMGGQNANTVRIPLPGGSTIEMLSGGNTHILHADWLGSSRLSTGYSNRQMAYDAAYAPYAETYVPSGSATQDQDFTGQFQDTFSGLYDFLYRKYSPVQGRWIAPDQAGLAAVDFSNPQSWNRYAYVLNNPLAYVDPSGLACYALERAIFGSCSLFLDNGANFGGSWNEFSLFENWVQCEYGDCQHYSITNGLSVALALGGNSNAANNGKSICSGAAGKTIPVNAPFGQMRFQFNGSGNLVGVGLQLTGMNGVSGNGLSIPPNTFAGFTQLSPGTVQFGFSNPVNVGSGFSQAYFQTATFSGGRFTSVQGAYAPLGIPLGSSSGNSSLMQWFLNGNSSTASQAQNFGNLLNSVASLVSSNVSCRDVFGGG